MKKKLFKRSAMKNRTIANSVGCMSKLFCSCFWINNQITCGKHLKAAVVGQRRLT